MKTMKRSLVIVALAMICLFKLTPAAFGFVPCLYDFPVLCVDWEEPPPCTNSCGCSPGSGGGSAGGASGAGGSGGSGGGGGGSGCVSCGGGGNPGMPYYWVSEPLINMRIDDRPSGYQPSRGLPVAFNLSYRQRGAALEDPTIFGVGTNWSCSFRSYVVDLTNVTSGLVRLHRGGAGWVNYVVGADQYSDGSVLTNASGGGYQITHYDGSIDLFQKSFVNGDGNILYFLTQQTDPAGNAITYTYSSSTSIVQLTSVTDPDGNVTSLYYENPTFTNQITRVVDPYSRTNILRYYGTGYLSNIVDVAGLSSVFVYDAANPGWITNMTTPYGTTSFIYGGVDAQQTTILSGSGAVNRYAEVILPTGGTNLFLYRLDCSAIIGSTNSPVPSTTPLSNTFDNVDQENRNSFFWDPLQG